MSGSHQAQNSLIAILKQTSPFEERVTRNGIQRDIHVVIKNSPFVVQIGLGRHCELDLNHIAFEAVLLYDTDGEKGVDFVKLKPIEYKCIPNESGDQVSIELRIKVLTSQHEDMFFKVKIQGTDPVSKQEIPNLKAITAPIKVISKPEQLKKRQPSAPVPAPMPTVNLTNPPFAPTLTVLPPTANMTTVNNAATNNNSNNNNSKKRTVNDLVVEAVTRIEKQQYDQANVLEKILQFIAMPKHENANGASWEYLPPLQKQRKDDSFEATFAQLLKSFVAIDPIHRAEKVRRVARTLSLPENEALTELVDMIMTEGLNIEAGREARPSNSASLLPPQHLDIKPNLYLMPTHQTHSSHPMHASMHNSAHSSHQINPHLSNGSIPLNMSKNAGEIDNYFFGSMQNAYAQVNVSGANNEEVYPDFLTTSAVNLPLGNSADFLNM